MLKFRNSQYKIRIHKKFQKSLPSKSAHVANSENQQSNSELIHDTGIVILFVKSNYKLRDEK